MKTKRLQRITLAGRDLSVKELRLIKEIVELYPGLSRLELSQTICENISWQAPNGTNKHNSCLRDPGELIQGRIDQWGDVTINKVSRGQLSLWNEYVQRYHYLGYKIPFGLHLRYFIVSGERILGCMLYTASAWALECRDKWIGWTYEQKERNLYRIINQSRFLILPWIQIKNLASHVLSLSIKQIGEDWQER